MEGREYTTYKACFYVYFIAQFAKSISNLNFVCRTKNRIKNIRLSHIKCITILDMITCITCTDLMKLN